MQIPRWIQVDSGQSQQKIELYVYGDASFDAYGANVYIRIKKEGGGYKTTLQPSKSGAFFSSQYNTSNVGAN